MIHRKIVSVSLTEATERLRVGRTTIYRWLKDDRIAALKEGGNWKIFLLQIKSEDSLSFFTLPHSALPDLVGENNHKMLTQEG